MQCQRRLQQLWAAMGGLPSTSMQQPGVIIRETPDLALEPKMHSTAAASWCIMTCKAGETVLQNLWHILCSAKGGCNSCELQMVALPQCSNQALKARHQIWLQIHYHGLHSSAAASWCRMTCKAGETVLQRGWHILGSARGGCNSCGPQWVAFLSPQCRNPVP